jgi:hypothetical protein
MLGFNYSPTLTLLPNETELGSAHGRQGIEDESITVVNSTKAITAPCGGESEPPPALGPIQPAVRLCCFSVATM